MTELEQLQARLDATHELADRWARHGGIYREQIIPELRAALTGRTLCRDCGHLTPQQETHTCPPLHPLVKRP